MAQITYANKVAINENPDVNAVNKVRDVDMNEIKEVTNQNTPVGSITLYAGSTAPTGWLVCDGSAISRTTYSNLFSVIGTTYGTGDGSTTFNLPNLKGSVPVGVDTSQTEFNTLGKTGGEKTHKHLTALGFDDTYLYGYAGSDTNPAYGSEVVYDIKRNSLSGFTQTDNQPARLAQTDNNSSLQPYLVLNYIISY